MLLFTFHILFQILHSLFVTIHMLFITLYSLFFAIDKTSYVDKQCSETKLVGGSGPYEGNILVGGLPVCDDHHNANNALVVCRSYTSWFCFKSKCKEGKKKPCEMHQAGQGSPSLRKTLPHSHIPPCSGCLGTPLATPPCNLSLEESTAPSQWMTSDAWATKPPSSTALTLLKKTVALMKEQEWSVV